MSSILDPEVKPSPAKEIMHKGKGCLAVIVAFADAPALYRHAATLPGIAVHGIDIHIGSQITELEPYLDGRVG